MSSSLNCCEEFTFQFDTYIIIQCQDLHMDLNLRTLWNSWIYVAPLMKKSDTISFALAYIKSFVTNWSRLNELYINETMIYYFLIRFINLIFSRWPLTAFCILLAMTCLLTYFANYTWNLLYLLAICAIAYCPLIKQTQTLTVFCIIYLSSSVLTICDSTTLLI
jgi:hypothetical protein